MNWGSVATVSFGDHLYVYGSYGFSGEDRRPGHPRDMHMHVRDRRPVFLARIHQEKDYHDRGNYEYWDGNKFLANVPSEILNSGDLLTPVFIGYVSGTIFHTKAFGNPFGRKISGCFAMVGKNVAAIDATMMFAPYPWGPWGYETCLIPRPWELELPCGATGGERLHLPMRWVYAHLWAASIADGELVISWTTSFPPVVKMAKVKFRKISPLEPGQSLPASCLDSLRIRSPVEVDTRQYHLFDSPSSERSISSDFSDLSVPPLPKDEQPDWEELRRELHRARPSRINQALEPVGPTVFEGKLHGKRVHIHRNPAAPGLSEVIFSGPTPETSPESVTWEALAEAYRTGDPTPILRPRRQLFGPEQNNDMPTDWEAESREPSPTPDPTRAEKRRKKSVGSIHRRKMGESVRFAQYHQHHHRPSPIGSLNPSSPYPRRSGLSPSPGAMKLGYDPNFDRYLQRPFPSSPRTIAPTTSSGDSTSSFNSLTRRFRLRDSASITSLVPFDPYTYDDLTTIRRRHYESTKSSRRQDRDQRYRTIGFRDFLLAAWYKKPEWWNSREMGEKWTLEKELIANERQDRGEGNAMIRRTARGWRDFQMWRTELGEQMERIPSDDGRHELGLKKTKRWSWRGGDRRVADDEDVTVGGKGEKR